MLKFDPYEFKTVPVKGVPVHVRKVPWANDFIYMKCMLNVGGRQDPVGKEGLSHFFEHVPFNGCRNHPTFDDIEKTSRSMLLETLNASTDFGRTEFRCKVDAADLKPALKFLADLIFFPILDPKEIERERGVITQEIWRKYSTERTEGLEKKLAQMRYGKHVFARMDSVIGWHDTVAKITRKDLIRFHKKHYHTGNLQIVLVGDLDVAVAKTAVKEMLSDIPRGKPEPRPAPLKSWPKPTKKEYSISSSAYYGLKGNAIPKTTSISVARAFPMPQNLSAINIGRQILRQILYERIRGRLGATYSPRVANYTEMDHSWLGIFVDVDPKRYEEARSIIESTLAEFRAGDLIHKKMFDDMKRIHIEHIHLSDENAEEISDEAVNMLMARGRIIKLTERLSEAERLKWSDVVDLFKKEFTPDKLFWFIEKP